MEGKYHDVVCKIRSAEKALIEEIKKLIPIIKTVIFCGVHIPLTGRRDDGDLKTEESSYKEGNFRALKFRVDAGDKDLLSHIESCGKIITYISKTI